MKMYGEITIYVSYKLADFCVQPDILKEEQEPLFLPRTHDHIR
jgi:hypothetical protein